MIHVNLQPASMQVPTLQRRSLISLLFVGPYGQLPLTSTKLEMLVSACFGRLTYPPTHAEFAQQLT